MEQRLRVLRKTAHALSGALNESQVVDALLSHIVTALQGKGALLRLLNPEGDELLPAGAVGLSVQYLQKGPVKLASSHIDRRVLDGEVVIVPDVTLEPGFQYPEAADEEGLRGLVAVPLLVRTRAIGVIRVYLNDVANLQPEDVLLLDTLADIGALTLEKMHMQSGLLRIAEALNSSLELQTMLQRVLSAAVTEMGLKAASIRLLDRKKQVLHLVAAHGLSPEYLAKGEIHVNKSIVDQKVLDGETVVIYDVAHDPLYEYSEEAAREGIRSVLVVPLSLKDKILGVMRAYSARPRHFGSVATNMLTSTAGLVALAIETAELYAALEERYEDLKVDLADWYRFLALG
jgi:GAF domain-containing protein